jgi:cytochrome P450
MSSARTTTSMGNSRPLIPLEVDRPEHLRYRRLLDPFFSPNRLRPLEPSLRQQISELIDTFIDKGAVDLLSDLFVPYPTQVFHTLYGLPLKDRPKFLRWKDMMIREGLTDPTSGARAVGELEAYMTTYFDERNAGGEDLISQFLLPNDRGDSLSREEIFDITALFIMAGLDTVTTALVHSFAFLARHPAERRRIVDDSSLIPGAVEELIRTTTPLPPRFGSQPRRSSSPG